MRRPMFAKGSFVVRCRLMASLLLFGLWCAVATESAPAAEAAEGEGEKVRVYVGTYTRGDSKGIYACELDLKTGALDGLKLVAETENPSFVALAPGERFLYAVNETGRFRGQNSGAVTAFAVDAETGNLTQINQQPSGGGAPCHLVVDAAGRYVLAANYSGGSVVVLPIEEGGKLGEAASFVQHEGSSVNPRRQEGPHAHSINLDPSNRFAFVADLGLDKVLVYRFDAASGKLTANDPPGASVKPGGGPRHFALHSSQRFAYTNNEITSAVTAFAFDKNRGTLSEVQTISTLPKDFTGGGNSTAEVQVHASGKFLYCSNRGHNSIAVFAIDDKTGKLSHVENESTRGEIPRNFGIDPTGAYLLAANQNTSNIASFRINQDTGALEPTGHSIEAPTPVCVKMVRLK